MSRPSNYPAAGDSFWDDQPLGKASDCAIARRLGYPFHAARNARLHRNIAKCPRHQMNLKYNRAVNWDIQPLGVLPDSEIAKATRCRIDAVRRARYQRNIPAPTCAGSQYRDWDNEPLGHAPDRVLAECLGVTRSAVYQARRARGIPAHRTSKDAQ